MSDPNPNHHLWNNHGTWFVVYTIYPTPITKERIRDSLQTRDVEVARVRRDALLTRLAAEGNLARPRFSPSTQNLPSTGTVVPFSAPAPVLVVESAAIGNA